MNKKTAKTLTEFKNGDKRCTCCCQFVFITLINFLFWSYVSGLLAQAFSDPKCYILDEDMEKMVQQEIAEHYPDVKQYLLNQSNQSKEAIKCAWPPLEFEGRQETNFTVETLDNLRLKFSFMDKGHYKPSKCVPHQKVAIVISTDSSKDPDKDLSILLNNILPKLYKQQLEFGIYVVRQQPPYVPNRGLMYNIGFTKAMEFFDYDCVVLHDVGVIPEDDRNYYNCGPNPRHLSKKIDKLNYELPHKDWAGGILSMTAEQFRSINGWSNMYNDTSNDDIFRRIVSKYDLVRTDDAHSFCSSSEDFRMSQYGCSVFEMTGRTWQYDGLNTTEYVTTAIIKSDLFLLYEVYVATEKIRQDYINRIKNMDDASLPKPTLTLANLLCQQQLNRPLSPNTRMIESV